MNTPTNQAMGKKLKNWWWATDGTGTEHCKTCRKPHICAWHTARLDDLSRLIESICNEVIGSDEKASNIFVPDERGAEEMFLATPRNTLRTEQRARLKDILKGTK